MYFEVQLRFTISPCIARSPYAAAIAAAASTGLQAWRAKQRQLEAAAKSEQQLDHAASTATAADIAAVAALSTETASLSHNSSSSSTDAAAVVTAATASCNVASRDAETGPTATDTASGQCRRIGSDEAAERLRAVLLAAPRTQAHGESQPLLVPIQMQVPDQVKPARNAQRSKPLLQLTLQTVCLFAARNATACWGRCCHTWIQLVASTVAIACHGF